MKLRIGTPSGTVRHTISSRCDPSLRKLILTMKFIVWISWIINCWLSRPKYIPVENPISWKICKLIYIFFFRKSGPQGSYLRYGQNNVILEDTTVVPCQTDFKSRKTWSSTVIHRHDPNNLSRVSKAKDTIETLNRTAVNGARVVFN